jgi:hypothetical protein
VQLALWIGNGRNMRTRLARQLAIIHDATPRAEAKSAT